MPKRSPFLQLLGRPTAWGRRALLCVLVAVLGGQGLSQAIERVAAPTHRHLPRSAGAGEALRPVAVAMPDAAPRPVVRDDHRSIPWIGGEPPIVDAAFADELHAHGDAAAHRHALTDAGVVYLDTDEDTSGGSAKPAVAAACPLPATPLRVACAAMAGPAAWRDAQRWHALALTGEPLDRPPR